MQDILFSVPLPPLQSVLIKHDLRSLEKIVINNEDQSGYCLALTRRDSRRRSQNSLPRGARSTHQLHTNVTSAVDRLKRIFKVAEVFALQSLSN